MDLHRSTLLQTDQAVDKHFNRENCKFHADDLHVHGIMKGRIKILMFFHFFVQRKLDDIVNKNLKPFAICCLKKYCVKDEEHHLLGEINSTNSVKLLRN
ncbi:hypothetical protein CK203_062191 [Vitis vinifera]|uniref:Uncharacterized protein n=1 Tax=Vitis vinifera TaxID=29760 RepID=A0A438GD41_VITVI|nr:hypothetical protein CK203_062191 [Vitis vinifera]